MRALGNVTKPCPICGWPLHLVKRRLVCVTPGCKYGETLPVDMILRERGAAPLPGFERERERGVRADA